MFFDSIGGSLGEAFILACGPLIFEHLRFECTRADGSFRRACSSAVAVRALTMVTSTWAPGPHLLNRYLELICSHLGQATKLRGSGANASLPQTLAAWTGRPRRGDHGLPRVTMKASCKSDRLRAAGGRTNCLNLAHQGSSGNDSDKQVGQGET